MRLLTIAELPEGLRPLLRTCSECGGRDAPHLIELGPGRFCLTCLYGALARHPLDSLRPALIVPSGDVMPRSDVGTPSDNVRHLPFKAVKKGA